MKKFLALFLALIISLSVFSISAFAGGTTYYVTGDQVRVRTSPKNEGDTNILCKLAYGTKVTVIGSKAGWSKVKLSDGKVGYIATSYLAKSGSSTSSNTTAVTKTSVELRQKASANAPILLYIPKGATVRVVSKKTTWAKVTYNSTTGFVPTKSLKKASASDKVCVGTYSISFSYSDTTRASNITKAVTKLNGKTVKAGESFSFLGTVGKSYATADEFSGYNVKGGGLAQVATCLHKAINDAQHNGMNINVVTKHRWTKKTPYAKKGEEAMIDIDGGQNFTFKNCSGSSIKIEASYDGYNTVVIKIYK